MDKKLEHALAALGFTMFGFSMGLFAAGRIAYNISKRNHSAGLCGCGEPLIKEMEYDN